MPELAAKTQQEAHAIIREFVEKIKPVFGSKLKSAVLFGSYARGDFNKESDIDVMLVVDDDEINLNKYDNKLTRIEVGINLKNDVVLAPLLMSEDKLLKYKNVIPFYKNVINEGVVIYEQ